ncbi:MAG: hypothetical protein R6U32_04535 [Candidatus Woesearchaeota archaeon]
MNQQLISYIQQQIKNGYDLNSIRNFLLQQGYNPDEVNESAEFVNKQRLSSLIEYVKSSLKQGNDPDSIRSQLSASGYAMPDINEALKEAGKSSSKFPVKTLVIVLVALVVFGLGLLFFWPSGEAEEATGPDMTEGGDTGSPRQDMADEEDTGDDLGFDTEKTVSFEDEEDDGTGEDEGFETGETNQSPDENMTGEGIETGGETQDELEEEDAQDEFEEVFSEENGGEENSAEDSDFSSKTSDFDSLIDEASDEENVDKALELCKKEENEMYRDACYDQLSKTFESVAICEKIHDQALQDSCYLRVVLKKRDYSLCENIVDSSLKSSCESLQNTAPPENATTDDLADLTV